jgi:hypothetical protein
MTRVVEPTVRRSIDIGLAPEDHDEATRLGALRVLAGWAKRELEHRDQEDTSGR